MDMNLFKPVSEGSLRFPLCLSSIAYSAPAPRGDLFLPQSNRLMVWECALFNTVDLILFSLQMELRASWKRNVGRLTDVSNITFYGEVHSKLQPMN